MADLVVLAEAEGVATLVLNRPGKLNAFGDDMREQLVAALETVARRPEVRALVLTGAGRAFSAGGDVRHMADLKARGAGFDQVRPLLDLGRVAITKLASLPIPTIAAVNGVAAGAGLNLALACDLRIASEEASFGETFVKIGLHPDWGGTYFLPRLVGLPRALELCWTGDVIDAEKAWRIGLVQRVVPDGQALEEARALALRLAAAPQAGIRLAKRTLGASLHRTLAQCLDAEAEAQEVCWETPDVAEGLRAFVEKRAPVFGGTGRLEEAPSPAARIFE